MAEPADCFERSATALARMLIVDRRLQPLIDRADAVLNRAVFDTADLLNVVLAALGVPDGECRPPRWDTYFTDVEPTLEACLACLRAVRGFAARLSRGDCALRRTYDRFQNCSRAIAADG